MSTDDHWKREGIGMTNKNPIVEILLSVAAAFIVCLLMLSIFIGIAFVDIL